MATISHVLPAGEVLTFGNPTDQNFALDASNSSNLVYVKTIVAGKWKSWTNGADAMFQGFSTFEKGKGYIGKVAATQQDITFSGNYITTTALPVVNGLNFLAFPYNGRGLGSTANQGNLPGLAPAVLKIKLSSGWKSWTRPSAPAFNGFNTIDEKQGYVTTIDGADKITKSNLVDSFVSLTTPVAGLRDNTNDTTVLNGDYAEGISFIDPNGVSTTGISFDAQTFDPEAPALIMFFKVGETLAKLDFAAEYVGERFYVTNGGNVYEGNFAENNDYTAATVVDRVISENPNIVFYYPSVTLNGVYSEVTVSVDGVAKTYEMDTAYEGQTFKFIKQNGDAVNVVLTAGELSVA